MLHVLEYITLPPLLVIETLLNPITLPQMFVAAAIYYYLLTRKRLIVLVPTMVGSILIINVYFSRLMKYINISILELSSLSLLIGGTLQIIATKRQWTIRTQLAVVLLLIFLVGMAFLGSQRA